jgi:hypothetical protein
MVSTFIKHSKMNKLKNLSLGLMASVLLIAGCKPKDSDILTDPELVATFTNRTGGDFYIQNVPNATFKVPVGITKPLDEPVTITVSVSSPTGAQAGQQYNLPSTTVTIPAGKVVDSLTVQGLFSGYATSRIDTLVFRITSSNPAAAPYNNTYRLVLQKYCAVTLSSFAGAWTQTNDNDGTPIYTSTVAAITAVNQTSATTGYIMVTGLWGVPGSGPIRVNLDWTNPANFKTDIPTGQPLYIHPTYGQASVRPQGSGTFSSCNNTLTLRYQVYVAAGNFAATTTTMAR